MKKYEDSIENRFTARHKKCIELVGNVKNKTILDIGCSYGWFEKFMSELECASIVGIDLNEKLLNQAKRQVNANNVTFRKGSALNLSQFKDSAFDIVVIFDVLEHIPKNTESIVFNELKRVLKKGGLLIISTPYKNFWSNFLDPAWYFGHRHYSKDKLNDLLLIAGFGKFEYFLGGGFFESFSMILLYPFKWLLNLEIPFKDWFDKKREKEYFSGTGFNTIFVRATKL